MQRLGRSVHELPNLDGWLIVEWPRDGGGLQLQQPDGNLFVYALCELAQSGTCDTGRRLGAGLGRPTA